MIFFFSEMIYLHKISKVFIHCSCGSGELVVKTSQDHWVVGRSGDGREFYVVVSHKNANLVEVTGE